MRDISINGTEEMMAVGQIDDLDDVVSSDEENDHHRIQPQSMMLTGKKRRQPPADLYSSELGQSMQHKSAKRPHLHHQPDENDAIVVDGQPSHHFIHQQEVQSAVAIKSGMMGRQSSMVGAPHSMNNTLVKGGDLLHGRQKQQTQYSSDSQGRIG